MLQMTLVHTDIRTPMTFNFIALMISMTSNQLGVVFLDSELTSADSYSGVWILGADSTSLMNRILDRLLCVVLVWILVSWPFTGQIGFNYFLMNRILHTQTDFSMWFSSEYWADWMQIRLFYLVLTTLIWILGRLDADSTSLCRSYNSDLDTGLCTGFVWMPDFDTV